MSSAVAETVVIGYGNPLRSDDGLGWHAIERLRGELAPEEAKLIACQQLAPELAAEICRAKQVIFVDACVGPTAGVVSVHMLQAQPEQAALFSHHVDPAGLLAAAQILFGSQPTGASLLSVAGASFEFGDQLSVPVRVALPRVIEMVKALAKTTETDDADRTSASVSAPLRLGRP